MNIEATDLELIVKQVIKNILPKIDESLIQSLPQSPQSKPIVKTYQPKENTVSLNPVATVDLGTYGVFDKMENAIDAAFTAQKLFVKDFQLKDRERLIKKIREVATANVETLAKMTLEETRLGRFEDKLQKNLLVIEKTPGTECLTTTAMSGDDGLTIVESAPFGVIGAITPVTNPTETIINNVISMIAGGNAVVFNVHPSAKKCCAYCLQMINKVIVDEGGPQNLATMIKEPSMDSVKILSESKKIRLLVGTGGMPMVNSLLKSGKKVIGAGAGNPPVVVDETADIKYAAKEIFFGASFDNNILCLAEKEVFVVEKVATDLIYHLIDEGAYLLNEEQVKQLVDVVFTTDITANGKEYHVNKKWVGQDASKILEAIGVTHKPTCKLLICEVDGHHPFVLTEQLMPVLPIVKCKNLEEAIHLAVEAEHGNRHTASIFSKDINHITAFAKEIETTIFVKNASTLAGVGFKGEGYTTMTIAGPTGEGLTNAKSFTRQRRCTLGDGGFRII